MTHLILSLLLSKGYQTFRFFGPFHSSSIQSDAGSSFQAVATALGMVGERDTIHLVEAHEFEFSGDVDARRRDAKDAGLSEACLRVDTADRHGPGHGRRHHDGQHVAGADDDLDQRGALGHIDVDAIADAGHGHGQQQQNEADRVHVELEADWFRVEDGAHQFALGCREAGADDDGQHFVLAIVARLQHLRAAEKRVLGVDVAAVGFIQVGRGRFRLRATLTCRPRHVERTKHCVISS